MKKQNKYRYLTATQEERQANLYGLLAAFFYGLLFLALLLLPYIASSQYQHVPDEYSTGINPTEYRGSYKF